MNAEQDINVFVKMALREELQSLKLIRIGDLITFYKNQKPYRFQVNKINFTQ